MINFNKVYKINWKESFIKIIPKSNHIRFATTIVLIVIGIFYFYQIVDAYKSARNIMGIIYSVQESIVNRDFEKSIFLLNNVNREIDQIENNIDRLYPFTIIPGISGEVRATQSLLAASKISIVSGISIVSWAKTIPKLSEKEFGSFVDLTEDDKKQVLSSLSDSKELWDHINNQTKLSIVFLNHAKAQSNIPLIHTPITNLTEKLIKAHTLFSNIQPWIAIAPDLLGYPTQKNYLLLLQNNTELRPTGGFIGTYGILQTRNGEISQFTTDNVYNLDEPAKAYNTKVPPRPMQKYIKQSQWFLRDVNWDPDFPTTAKNAIQFYKDERGPVKQIDGVIAFTPDLIEDLLKVLGPVYVDGKQFTSDNLIDTLAYHVELGFKEEGITEFNRKQIIDDVATQLKEKLLNLTPTQIKNLAPLVFQSINQRQLMFYFENEQAQNIVHNLDWDGRVKESTIDYVYIVDANLGSLKSDPAINRTISHQIRPTEEGLFEATTSITYEHTGNFDWKTTRYRTYARMYVPLGSTFVSATGNEEDIAITDEHGKTVFGTFISIEPLDSETLTFSYMLPEEVSIKINQGNYELYVQKQAGTSAHILELDIELGFNIHEVSKGGNLSKKNGNHVFLEWDLGEDRVVSIQSKK